eukprot:9966833-Alexandrium_andersonii.AAC.1
MSPSTACLMGQLCLPPASRPCSIDAVGRRNRVPAEAAREAVRAIQGAIDSATPCSPSLAGAVQLLLGDLRDAAA